MKRNYLFEVSISNYIAFYVGAFTYNFGSANWYQYQYIAPPTTTTPTIDQKKYVIVYNFMVLNATHICEILNQMQSFFF